MLKYIFVYYLSCLNIIYKHIVLLSPYLKCPLMPGVSYMMHGIFLLIADTAHAIRCVAKFKHEVLLII